MNIVKLTDVTRHQQDGMPNEVATSLLTEPRAKLSNRMRKNARSAREKVFPSVSPIINTTNIDDPENPLAQYTGIEPKSAEARLVEKSKRATWAQLHKWSQRCKGRRMAVQGKYVKIEAEKPKNPRHAKQ